MTKMSRHYPVLEVSYAAATYAVATGAKVDKELLKYRSESQILIAGAAYAALLDQSWQRVAVAAGCPNEKNKFTSLGEAVKYRRRKGLLDLDLFELCKLAVIERRIARRAPATAQAQDPVPVPDVRAIDLPPIRFLKTPDTSYAGPKPTRVARPEPEQALPIVPPHARQIRKPETDLDKEIYGTPLNRKLTRSVRTVTTSVLMPGDKEDDRFEVDRLDLLRPDSAHVEVEPRDRDRLGSVRIAPPKKITLPRIPSLERPLTDD